MRCARNFEFVDEKRSRNRNDRRERAIAARSEFATASSIRFDIAAKTRQAKSSKKNIKALRSSERAVRA
jgi:hypothetical protein